MCMHVHASLWVIRHSRWSFNCCISILQKGCAPGPFPVGFYPGWFHFRINASCVQIGSLPNMSFLLCLRNTFLPHIIALLLPVLSSLALPFLLSFPPLPFLFLPFSSFVCIHRLLLIHWLLAPIFPLSVCLVFSLIRQNHRVLETAEINMGLRMGGV